LIPRGRTSPFSGSSRAGTLRTLVNHQSESDTPDLGAWVQL
jgi:hypothetical protein